MMNDAQARARSSELIDCGYLEWLSGAISKQGVDMFASAVNDAELRSARMVYDMSERICSIVTDNARE